MIGELSALGSAFTWAVTSLVLRSQSSRIEAVAMNAVRCVFASVFFGVALVVFGEQRALVRIPPETMLLLLASVITGLAMGDTMYMASLPLLGVARAMPLSMTYPFFTVALAALLLREPVTAFMVLGALLAAVGVYLVAMPGGRAHAASTLGDPAVRYRGVALALAAALCWALSTVLMRPAMEVVDTLVANSVRLPAAALLLLALAWRRKSLQEAISHGWKPVSVVGVAGLITGVSAALFLAGIQFAGAAKSSILTSTSPLFAAPMAALFAGERVTARIAAGTIVCMAGIWLVFVS